MSHQIARPLRFLIVHITPSITPQEMVDSELLETAQLIATYGGKVISHLIQRKNKPDPNFYLGRGKVTELQMRCEAEEIDVVVINNLIKSSQLFRLEKELWSVSPNIKVWDRIDLILNIFDQHATTVEAKLQIKLARATHMGPRIYGLGKTELSRQGGGIGNRGKGETNIEFEKRKIKQEQQKIKKELKKLISQKRARLNNRKERGIGPVALVGYTSAGKTTLFNALTGKDKEINRGLFTTLDTVVGKLRSPLLDQPILVSDTIGFISNLPPVLIDSFKSTLLESLEAKLLLHIVDSADPLAMSKVKVVEEILDQLHANQPRILVLNKLDLITDNQTHRLNKEIESYFNDSENQMKLQSVIKISAQSGNNLDVLKNAVSTFFCKLHHHKSY